MPATPRALRVASVVGAIGLVLVAAGAGMVGSACSSSAKLIGANGACELASDCEEGLVCIPQPGSATGRICSSDLGTIQMTEFPDTGTDATAGDDASDDGAITTYPTPDGGAAPTPDATTTPPKDSGSGTTPPKDSGTPAQDSSTPPADSGPADSGSD